MMEKMATRIYLIKFDNEKNRMIVEVFAKTPQKKEVLSGEAWLGRTRRDERGWLRKPRRMLVGEWSKLTPCAVCGRKGYAEWWTPDEEWQKYVSPEFRNTSVCILCFKEFVKNSRESRALTEVAEPV